MRGGRARIVGTRALATTMVALVAPAAHLGAQDASRSAAPPGACYGFSFGKWIPPLDSARRTPSATPAPSGGGIGDATSTDSTLVLFPPWWPVGIGVRFDAPIGSRDTLDGTAYAFVSDGRLPVPSARVRAWRKRCGA